MINAIIIDVEDYFHATTFVDRVEMDAWGGYPSRIVEAHNSSCYQYVHIALLPQVIILLFWILFF